VQTSIDYKQINAGEKKRKKIIIIKKELELIWPGNILLVCTSRHHDNDSYFHAGNVN